MKNQSTNQSIDLSPEDLKLINDTEVEKEKEARRGFIKTIEKQGYIDIIRKY